MSDGKGTNYSSKIKTLGDGEVSVTVVESPAKIGAALFDVFNQRAGIAQLGERQTEDLKVACSIHAHRIFYILCLKLSLPFELSNTWSSAVRQEWPRERPLRCYLSLLEIEDVSHEHASHAAIRASGSDGETHFNVKMSPPSSRTSPWLTATVWSRRPR
ncbi:hypothetical protein SAY87_007510 [Trapa incisa]|uniref:Uncharacterized protein n=1 Tax=Trapa incisa TaxID=236973 RepID=A0AAN7KBN7_9MYRT|nr:hypothetical protein SAY87_007510 [Trapa incisa]